jgi:hypothetical protein
LCHCHPHFLETTSVEDDNLRKSTKFIDVYFQYLFQQQQQKKIEKKKEIMCKQTKHIVMFYITRVMYKYMISLRNDVSDNTHVRIKYITEIFL